MKLVLFGNNYNYVDGNSIVFESNSKLVAHIPSAIQLDELFTVQHLSATNFLAGNRSQNQYIGCSKIILEMEDGELDGYIVNTDDKKWTVHCPSNIKLKIPPLRRDTWATDNGYIITNETFTYNNITFSVLEYHPI